MGRAEYLEYVYSNHYGYIILDIQYGYILIYHDGYSIWIYIDISCLIFNMDISIYHDGYSIWIY